MQEFLKASTLHYENRKVPDARTELHASIFKSSGSRFLLQSLQFAKTASLA